MRRLHAPHARSCQPYLPSLSYPSLPKLHAAASSWAGCSTSPMCHWTQQGTSSPAGFGPAGPPLASYLMSWRSVFTSPCTALAARGKAGADAVVDFSPLHYNIEDFSMLIVPSYEERKKKESVIQGIRDCTFKAFPTVGHMEVEVFGSFANGLSTWSSDVDMVVTGLMQPSQITGGYSIDDRAKVAAKLRKITDKIRRDRRLGVDKLQVIARAKMPIIKLRTRSGVDVDISMGDGSGPDAAGYMFQQVHTYPQLQPLLLVLKTYLKSKGLNDVMHGGLSSYSLCNMVIAHLQDDQQYGREHEDLGESLYGFFLRYGEGFDYEMDAVSIANGGFVPKSMLGFGERRGGSNSRRDDDAGSGHDRLSVDCPLSGRDVSNGTYRIDLVRDSFARAARALEDCVRDVNMGLNFNYLEALFDVQRVLRRAAPLKTRDYEVLEERSPVWHQPESIMEDAIFPVGDDSSIDEDVVLIVNQRERRRKEG